MQRRQMLKLLGGGMLGGGLTGLCGPGAAATACGGYPAGDRWAFDVLRHDAVIGDHVFTFSRGTASRDTAPRDAGDFVVEVAIDITVGFLGVTLFRFTHRAEEIWRGGLLQALTSETDDDGTLWQVRYERQGDNLRGSVNGAPAEGPGDILPASLWHPDTPRATRLLDTVDGGIKPVAAVVLAPPPAGHFRLTGGIEREVWTDAACGLTRVVFPARDGSLITLARR
ncbi:DUF6134 family protein [Pelagibius sp. 7325]|uniref:DUF6134 family protein n=1 Tax=Pelagibius sp. 7325 TaxID=3131994 RepID=UPI0030EB839D